MSKSSILYSISDISRNDILTIHGSQENVAQILDIFKNHTYKHENLSVFPATRVTMTHVRNILLTLPNYDMFPIGDEEVGRLGNTIPFAAIVVQKWCYGYYHFVNEVLHKIIRVSHYNPKIPILLPHTKFIEQILHYLKLPNPILYFEPGKQYYTIKFGIVISETRSGNPTPNDIQLVRDSMRLNEPADDQVNIVLYRKEARRNIINFDEMMISLRSEFPTERWVLFDSMSFEECVRLFGRAKLIVGAHGAGLSNMIFSRKGTPVVELFPSNMINVCYWHLSWILNNPHFIVACDAVDGPACNLRVDCKHLLSLLHTIIPPASPYTTASPDA
jgi:hypothetical protein